MQKLLKKPLKKGTKISPEVLSYAKTKEAAHKRWLRVSEDDNATFDEKQIAKDEFINARKVERQAKRRFLIMLEEERNSNLHSILTKNPSELFKTVKNSRKASSSIHELKVGDKIYSGNSVSDGFFDSLSQMKTADYESFQSSSSFQTFLNDFENIKEICEKGEAIPKISLQKASDILRKIRPNVNDYFSITALHYINGGAKAIEHLCHILNSIIENINNAALPEVNTVYANILHFPLS